MSYVSVVTADAPVFWMRFAEPDGSTLFTSEGGTFIANLSGTGNVIPGPIANALAFGAGSGYLVSDYGNTSFSAVTYSFFVKNTNTQNGHHYMSMHDATYGGLYMASGQDIPYAAPAVGYPGFGWLQGTAFVGRKSTTEYLSDGAWHHVIARFAGVSAQAATTAQCSLWIDGMLVDDTNMTNGTAPTMPQTTSVLRIGQSYNGTYAGGFSIAEVAVFDKALTTLRIQSHFRESGFLPALDVFYGSAEVSITVTEKKDCAEAASINVLLTVIETDKHADAGSINVHPPRVQWSKKT